jgi:hypothetical protein
MKLPEEASLFPRVRCEACAEGRTKLTFRDLIRRSIKKLTVFLRAAGGSRGGLSTQLFRAGSSA